MSVVGEVWDQLVGAAVLGASRRGGGWEVPEALHGLDRVDASPERRMARGAAALSVYLAAGQRPRQIEVTEAPVSEGGRPAGAEFEAVLAGALRSEEWLVPEALERLVEGAWHVPWAFLPAILNRACACGASPDLVRRAVGPRGRWVASQNEAWAWVVSPDASSGEAAGEVWENGDRAARLGVLSSLRAVSPGAAVGLIESTWDADAWEDRAAFIAALDVGLVPEDEPLLERALDDKRKGVREAARGLLSRLPGSAFGGRMRERAALWVRFDTSGLIRKRLSIEVAPPEAVSREDRRDGIELRARGGMGAQGVALHELAAALPLDWWERASESEPRGVIEAINRTDWSEPLSGGLARAAETQRDARWAAALAECINVDLQTGMGPRMGLVATAARYGSDVDRVAGFRRWAVGETGLRAVAEAIPAPWSKAVSREAVAQLRKVASQAEWRTWRGSDLMVAGERIARCAALADLGTLRLGTMKVGESGGTDVHRALVRMLELRERLARATMERAHPGAEESR